MAKAEKKQKPESFEKEYQKIMGGSQVPVYQNGNQQQWVAQGDFFVKFSIYKELPSGVPSSNTVYISK